MIIRKAKLSDVEAIHHLVEYYSKKGLMLPRSRSSLYEFIRDYTVVEIDSEVVGMGALNILWSNLAEVRTLAVNESLQGKKIGKTLVNYLLEEARELGIHRVFTLTYQAEFFTTCGFKEINKEKMPQKIWKDCLNCPKFPNCDEICMVTHVKSEPKQ